MTEKYICPICGNEDPVYIGYLNNKPYCRRCITFKGEAAFDPSIVPRRATYKLDYELSDDQKRLSNSLITNYKKGTNSLVHAVCGSGKTEIVLEVIKYAIECGDKVGFAVPRRDVVIELYERFKTIFKRNKISLVYGGHTDKLIGDLVCLTTHQLFRYSSFFDLLILDEVDAFPFKGDEVLNSLFTKSLKGKYILLSATPDDELIKKFSNPGYEILELFSRFHGHPLPVPSVVKINFFNQFSTLLSLLKKYQKEGKQVFIFCPTIDICYSLYRLVKPFYKLSEYVHSKRKDRNKVIENFKSGGIMFLFTTAVLERGVTVKNLQVIVFKADHDIYDQYSLVQIAGRVGRKKDAPDGEVIFLAQRENDAIKNAIKEIKRANENL